ncbi:GNAT family N-acetyltransferase [Flavobacterium aquiphilum]|uniref:GNAT family N-acetyltransferase n=1 Tax=Flavobacterium aquiphilum TaxID=3003261 RepID=UPI00247FC83E|nr:GNAT family N-acetyltransferase [Flavobacterium aquiphilum]
MINIEKITDLETYSVRHVVLRKGKPIETCKFEGDDLPSTSHFGYYINDDLVGIISVFKTNNNSFSDDIQYQIRGMAVLESYQKKGIGESLVKHCEIYCNEQQADLIWFNARTAAVGFYEKLGYVKVGEAFEIKDVGEHYLMVKSI